MPRARPAASSRTSRRTSPSSSPAARSAPRTTWPSSTSTGRPAMSATCASPRRSCGCATTSRGRRRQPGPHPRARADGRRGARRARQLPLRGSRRPRRRDRRRRALSRCSSGSGGTSSTPSSTSRAGAARSTTAPPPTATRGRARSAACTRPTAARTSCRTPPRTAESCANIGMILWGERMLSLTGDAEYADVIEQIAFNSLLASISLDGSEYFYTNAAPPGARPARTRSAVPGDTGQHPTPAAAAVRRAAARALPQLLLLPAEHRAHAGALPRARGLAVGRTGSSCTSTAAATLDVTHRRRAAARAARGRATTPGARRVDLHGHGCRGRRHPAPPAHPRLVVGRDAHRQRRARGGERARHLRPHRAGVAGGRRRRADAADARARAARPPPRRGDHQPGRGRSAGPVVYCLESADLPDGVVPRAGGAAPRRRARARRDRGRRPAASSRSRASAVVLPAPTRTRSTPTSRTPSSRTLRGRLIPYFAWGNRGPGEMSVWLPLVW